MPFCRVLVYNFIVGLQLNQTRQTNPPPARHLKKRHVTNGLALLGLTVDDDFVGGLVCAKVRDM